MKKETIAVKLNERNEHICLGSCILESIGRDKINSQPFLEQPKPMEVSLVYNQSEQYARVMDENTAKLHLLSQGESVVSDKIMFSHAGVCPHFEMTHDKQKQYQNMAIDKQVTVAVCGMLTDSDGMILLTKRQSFMRTYPNCWVLPGGLVDPQETFLETVLREIKEEIGITIFNSENKVVKKSQEKEKEVEKVQDMTNELTLKEQPKAFFLYESVFPTELSIGDPQRCSLILFYQIKVSQKFHEILLNQESQEIQQSAWISPDILRQILRLNQQKYNHINNCSQNGTTTSITNPPSHIHTALSLDNKQLSIELISLLGIYPNNIGEGIGEAHIQALDYLLNTLQTKNNFNFKQSL